MHMNKKQYHNIYQSIMVPSWNGIHNQFNFWNIKYLTVKLDLVNNNLLEEKTVKR